MVVAHDAGDFPGVGLLLPDHHELGVTAVVAAVFDVAKPLRGDVHGPVVFHGVHFQAARYQRAGDVGGLGKQARKRFLGLGEVGQAAFIGVKLHVFGKVGHELSHVFGIEGGEHFRVQSGHGLV